MARPLSKTRPVALRWIVFAGVLLAVLILALTCGYRKERTSVVPETSSADFSVPVALG